MSHTNKNLTMNTDIVKELVRHLTDSGQIQRSSRQFAALKTNFERVDFVYDLLKERNLLPDLVKDEKNDYVSVDFRQKGNAMYKAKRHKEALELYTQSIAHAENESANLGLAYANRSAVLFQQKMYKECLIDINHALGHNYPENLHEKLQLRRKQATDLQPTQIFQIYHDPAPKIAPQNQNSLIKCASDSVEIKNTEELGRHVVATKNINIGDLIAVEESYSRILLDDYFSHCHECLELCHVLIPCEKCTKVLYCSENCKNLAYTSYHQYECSILATTNQIKLDKLEIFPMKIALKARSEYENLDLDNYKLKSGEIYESGRYKELHNLVGNTEKRPVSDLFGRAFTAAVIFHLVKTYTSFFQGKNLEKLQEQFKEVVLWQIQTAACNFHEISELVQGENGIYEPHQIGDGSFPFLSMFNHSCFPNVVRDCHGSTIAARAIQTIKKGEQCFENYGCHQAIMEKPNRQKKLLDQFYFLCKCVACEDNWPLYIELPMKGVDMVEFFGENVVKLQKANRDTAKEVLPSGLKKIKELELRKPSKNFSEFQEVIKQCFAIFGNVRRPLE